MAEAGAVGRRRYVPRGQAISWATLVVSTLNVFAISTDSGSTPTARTPV